ncbi:hypothetical protein Sjap_008295 [Stephania japonica]|uniref:Uncharacterized protein n=1 Tax=Stephania japonica TaxID=461633 RepID=A0AAP0JQ09_9MAGN
MESHKLVGLSEYDPLDGPRDKCWDKILCEAIDGLGWPVQREDGSSERSEPTSDGDLDKLYRVEMDGVKAKYKSCGPDMWAKILQKLREITGPASTLLSVSKEELATKGRPKKKGKNLKMKMLKSKKSAVDNSTKRDPFSFEYVETKATQESVAQASAMRQSSKPSQPSQPSQGPSSSKPACGRGRGKGKVIKTNALRRLGPELR